MKNSYLTLLVLLFTCSFSHAQTGVELVHSGTTTLSWTEDRLYHYQGKCTVKYTLTFAPISWNGNQAVSELISDQRELIYQELTGEGRPPPDPYSFAGYHVRIARINSSGGWESHTTNLTGGVSSSTSAVTYALAYESYAAAQDTNAPVGNLKTFHTATPSNLPVWEPQVTSPLTESTPLEPVTETFYPITNNTGTDQFLWLPQIQQGLVIPAGQTYNVPAGDGLYDGYYEFYDIENIALDVDTGEYMPFGTPSKKGNSTFKQVEATEGSTIFDDIYSQNPDITIIEAEKPYKIETRDGKEWLVQKDNNKVIGNVETDPTTGKKTIEPFVDPSPPLQIEQPADGVEARLDRLIEIEEERNQNVSDGLEAAEDSRNALDSLTADAVSDVQDIVGEINLTAPNSSNSRTLDFGAVETPLGVVEFKLTGIFTIFNTVMTIFREFAVWVLTLFFGFRGLRKFTEDAKQALTVPQMGVLTGVENLAPAATQTKFLIIAGVIAVTYIAMVGGMGVYYNSQVFSLMGSITPPSSPSIGASGGFGDVVAWVDTNLFPIWLMVQYFIAYCVAYIVNFIAFFVAAIIVKLLNL
jgi:hypothetical protein